MKGGIFNVEGRDLAYMFSW